MQCLKYFRELLSFNLNQFSNLMLWWFQLFYTIFVAVRFPQVPCAVVLVFKDSPRRADVAQRSQCD